MTPKNIQAHIEEIKTLRHFPESNRISNIGGIAITIAKPHTTIPLIKVIPRKLTTIKQPFAY
jgi:hypothetical protein